ncbi:MAG TPA: protoporphyrinogen oxidase [Planktothrix sp.]|jgi:oxygen-dependent protoporphyrinogen oxidase
MKVVVVGGGIAGLTAAYRLGAASRQKGSPVEVLLLEAGTRLGGIISTATYEGSVIEHGPDSFITTKPAALKLCKELGLENNVIATDSRFRRAFVAFQNKLHPVPEGFFMMAPSRVMPLLQSSLFSFSGKVRILSEPMVPAKSKIEDESLSSFVRRRLGEEALRRLAQPMMAGIYTADPDKLSLLSTMPQFLEHEVNYGSVIVGLQEKAKQKPGEETGENNGNVAGARYSIFVTLDKGLGLLPATLQEKISPENIRLNARVEAVTRADATWRVRLTNGETIACDAVVLALPSGKAARVLDVDDELQSALASIESASSVVLNLVYKRRDIADPLTGFGFVVPATEKRNIIACSFSSVKFPNRAPEGMATLRVFMGGALSPHLVRLPEKELFYLAARDLRRYIGIKSDPVWRSIARWPNSMPQYHVGHMQIVEKIKERLRQLPGLHLAGNSYEGVGLPDSIRSAEEAARQVLEFQPSSL